MQRGGPLKRTGSLRPRSKKKSAEYVERRKLVSRLLDEQPYCQACPVFAKYDEVSLYNRKASVDIHELKRRSQGGSILEEDNLLAVCRELVLHHFVYFLGVGPQPQCFLVLVCLPL